MRDGLRFLLCGGVLWHFDWKPMINHRILRFQISRHLHIAAVWKDHTWAAFGANLTLLFNNWGKLKPQTLCPLRSKVLMLIQSQQDSQRSHEGHSASPATAANRLESLCARRRAIPNITHMGPGSQTQTEVGYHTTKSERVVLDHCRNPNQAGISELSGLKYFNFLIIPYPCSITILMSL